MNASMAIRQWNLPGSYDAGALANKGMDPGTYGQTILHTGFSDAERKD